MKKKSERIVRYTDAKLRAMRGRGETKSDFKAAALKPLPDGSDPDDTMPDDTTDELDWGMTELTLPKGRRR